MKRKAIIGLLAFFLASVGAVAALAMESCNGSPAATVATESTIARQLAAPAGAEKTKTGSPAVSTQTTAATTPKSDNSGNYQPTVTAGPAPGPAPAGASGLPNLSCSLTAESNPDGSISLLFYVQGPGFFTVQENISGAWQATRQNVFYSGTGGLDAGSLPAGASSSTLRLLKIVDGAYVSQSSDFTVKRQDVISAGGLKTYRG